MSDIDFDYSNENDMYNLAQIATAAGHGDGHILTNHNAEWVQIEFDERNTRPNYDLRFIKTFSPHMVLNMLSEIKTLQQKVADLGEEKWMNR